MLPSLNQFNHDLLRNNVWQRGVLSLRDRCLITIVTAVTLNEQTLLKEQLTFGLEHGISTDEIDALITHLAFYSGWGKALEASQTAVALFNQLNINRHSIDTDERSYFEIDDAFEQKRASTIESNVGHKHFPHLVDDTTAVLFHDLWLRTYLTPRDRSLITVSALISNGQVDQISFHLNKAMDNGLTQEQAAEVVSHLAYYAGWPNAMSAVPIIKTVFNHRY